MIYAPPIKLALLEAALELPLTPAEIATLRDIHLALSMGVIQQWGFINSDRQEEVRLLFNKCSEMLKPHVP